MRVRLAAIVLLAAGLEPRGFTGTTQVPPPAGEFRRISLDVLEDKIRGGWAGQMIGVSFGAPTEFRSNGRRIEGELAWSPERVDNSLDQDDLYVEMTFAGVMDRIGLDATSEDYGRAFRDSRYRLWHANAAARRLLDRGLLPPLTGDPRYNLHADDIDFQIESDFIGLMAPGLPREANRFCERVGRIMNSGDGLYGGMFVTGMYAAAFFESDVRRVVEQGLASIPSESAYARLIRDVLARSAQHPDDWTRTWQLVQDRWDRDDPCPDGALRPFNIDAKLNGAYIAIGLLYGKGDFSRTVELTTRCGQDSDCNPSNAAGILGVMLGYDRIPDEWRSGIPAIASRRFEYTDYTFDDIVRSTVERAKQVVRRAGGEVTDRELRIPVQTPEAPPLEQMAVGRPVRVIEHTDPDLVWKGDWRGHEDDGRVVARAAEGSGSEMTLTFEGTGIAIVGPMSQAGGRADVFLDGERAGDLDAFIVERTYDNDLWHTFGLRRGLHSVRIVTRGDADRRSTGTRVAVARAIVYDEANGPR